ncbi:hypothetical protein JCM11641_001011, partial [Rhodosporidiobolus odoratus]
MASLAHPPGPLTRLTLLWSLYRPLLRATSSLQLEQQQPRAVRDYVREEFKRGRKSKAVKQAQRKAVEGQQFLRDLERANVDIVCLDRVRQLAQYLLARRAVTSPSRPPPPCPPPARKPRPVPSILHSTQYHPPMIRLRPQPVGLSMMIFNRRRATQKRFDKVALAREMVVYGLSEDEYEYDRSNGGRSEGWGREWEKWIREAKQKEAKEYRRNE